MSFYFDFNFVVWVVVVVPSVLDLVPSYYHCYYHCYFHCYYYCYCWDDGCDGHDWEEVGDDDDDGPRVVWKRRWMPCDLCLDLCLDYDYDYDCG